MDLWQSLIALGQPECRVEALRAIAVHSDVEEVLLLVRDPDLPVLLPAAGLPQTLRGGPLWRGYLKALITESCTNDVTVDLPEGSSRTTHAVLGKGAVLLLLGRDPAQRAVCEIRQFMPMLSSLLTLEQRALIYRAQAEVAKEAVSRAHTLAEALETARSDAARLNAELREQNRQKDQFLAMLGHELRNPLSSLSLSIEVLIRAGDNAEVRMKQLSAMRRQALQLSRLVDDLLDVSRVSRGRIELQSETLVLSELLEHALEDCRFLFTAREQTVGVLGPGEPLAVQGDRTRLTQVFANIMNNAAKYTPMRGSIEVSWSRDGGFALVRVKDNGIGIDSDMLARIFDLFAQVPSSIHQSHGGLGIGLTLVRSLVNLHGGRVRADSEGLGKGTTMSVWLPLAC